MTKEPIIDQLTKTISCCTKCRLAKTAIHPVPGEGDINAELVFVGEAPGQTEDETGRPFVGRAGRLLTALLGAIGMKREHVWIGNIIKHRPPENRDPLPDEIAACEGYLEAQLRTINPVLVVTLGRFSMAHFISDAKISKDHGRVIYTKGKYVYPLYHPAAALRSSQVMEDLKADFVRIPKVLADAKSGVYKPADEKKSDMIKGQVGLGL